MPDTDKRETQFLKMVVVDLGIRVGDGPGRAARQVVPQRDFNGGVVAGVSRLQDR